MNRINCDVLVIGAGPAGSLAAAMLHRAGYSVHIVEKQRFPRFVIGESLLPRIMDNLQKADLLQAVQNQGFQVKRGARFNRDGALHEFDFAVQHTPGWSWTWQVPRADFDHCLAQTVAARGVSVHYEEGIERVDFSGERALLFSRQMDGTERQWSARFVIDASGYGRALPRLLDLDAPSDFPVRHAFFTHFNDRHRPADHSSSQIQIVLHEGVWVWVIPFSNGKTSVGFVAAPEFFARYAGSPEERFRAIAAEMPELNWRFGADVDTVFEPQTIAGYSIKVKQFYGDKFVLAGNATEFLDPVLSSGVMFAVESGTRAGELVAEQLGGRAVDWQSEYVDHMQNGIDVFRSYVSAWYNGDLPTIFFAKHQNPTIKKCICSVLARYVWDQTNPYVVHHRRALSLLAQVIRLNEDLVPAAMEL